MIAAMLALPLALTPAEHQALSQNVLGYVGEGLVALGLLGGAILIYRRAPGWWNAHMKRRHAAFVAAQGESIREKALKQEVEDILLKGLQKSADEQHISQKEHHKTLAWLNERLGLKGLVPSRRDPEAVKQKLKAERATREQKKAVGFKAGK